MTFDQLLDALTKGGVIGLLAIIVIGGSRQWWVYGWLYRAMLAERDFWRRKAEGSTALAERAVEAAVKDAADVA